MLTGREVIEQCRRIAPSEKIAQEMACAYIEQRGAICWALLKTRKERSK